MYFNLPVPRKLLNLLLFGLLIRLFLAWLPERYFYYLISDDAYYYFAVAKNLVNRGIFSADGITLTNGFHPLWLFVITPLFLIFQQFPWFSIHLVVTFSALFDTAAALLIFMTLNHLGKEKLGFWAAAFYLVNPYGLLHTLNGLETAQNNFFLTLLVYMSLKASPEWLQTGWFRLGAVCGLALLSRTDNVFAVGALLTFLFWQNRNLASIAKTVAVAALLVLPWLMYNYLTFGSIVQTSGTVYPWHYHQQYLSQHQTYLSTALPPFLVKKSIKLLAENAGHYGHWGLTLLVGGLLLLRLIQRPGKYRPRWWALAGAGLFLFFHVFFRWSVRPWYPQAVLVLTLPAVALSLEGTNRYLMAIGAALALVFSWRAVWATPFPIAKRSPVMLNIIKKHIPAGERVGVFNSGYVQYFTDQRVINLDGLVNNEILPYYKKKKGLEYLRQRNINWLVDTPTYLTLVFGLYFGPEADRSLAVANLFFVNVSPDLAAPTNGVLVAQVLPDSLRPPPGRNIPLGRAWKIPLNWKRVSP